MAEKKEFGPDFRFLVRLINTDLDGKKPAVVALSYVPGVSHRMARIVCRESGVKPDSRIGTLKDAELQKLGSVLESMSERVPEWMRNRQNDPESGDDHHMVGTEIAITLREDLNRLKKIRSWRGHRHERKLPTRGQRTKNNGRFGPAVGVMKAAGPAEGGAPPAEGAPKAAGGGGAKPLGGAKPAAAAAPAAAAGAKPAAGAAKPAAAPAKPAAGAAKK